MTTFKVRTGFWGLMAAGLLFCSGVQGDVVEDIAVLSDDSGSGFMPAALAQRVYHIIRTQKGDEFSPKVLDDDIKELMGSGSFDDVRVETVSRGPSKIALNIFVRPKPAIREIEFRGNKEYKSKKLLSTIEDVLTTNVPAEERTIASARLAILNKYRDAGYYGTEVTTLQEKPADGQGVNIVFVIKEEPHYKLKGVYFPNASVFEEDDLRDVLMTKRQWWRYIIRFGNYYNPMLEPLDKEALKKKYHNAGYLDFAVEGINLDLIEENTWVKVVYTLQEGEPYQISDVSVAGATVFPAEELMALTTSKPGMTYNADNDKLDTSRIKSKYGEKGYIDIHVWTEMKKDTAAHKVALVYHVSEGKSCVVRDIKIVGNETTREKIIRRELAIGPGDPGNPDKIDISKARLMNLGYFSKVDIVPAVTEDSTKRDLRISLEERPTANVSVGAAFSTEDSVLGQLEYSETNFFIQRLFEQDWPPRGGGQRFRTHVALGSETSNVSISLEEPWFLDRRLNLRTELFLRNRFEDEYDQRNIGAEVMLKWPIKLMLPFTDLVDDKWNMGVGLRLEYVRISDCDEYNDDDFDWSRADKDCIRDHVVGEEEGSYWANRLVWRVARDSRNAYRFPTSGSLIEFQTEFVTSALGSYEDYFRFSLGGTKYYQVLGDRVFKLGAGISTATGDDDVAIFDRYFGGGVGTLRGFKRRTVSPVDRHDDPMGGDTILTGTAELLQPVKDFMYVSVFSDVGSVWWETAEVDFDNLCMSLGVGLQFKALPISLYYGFPVVRGYDHQASRGRFHFSLNFSY